MRHPCTRHLPGLAAKVAFLGRPESYPGRVGQIETIETHMSWLFLTDKDVYKLKKPYRHERINYATAAARRRNCRRELQINRRLAADCYLEIVTLTVDGDGRMRLNGDGRPIDWLVHMRRLPETLSLERQLREGEVRTAQIDQVVACLCPLFRDAPRVRWHTGTYLRHLRRALRVTLAVLGQPAYAGVSVDLAAYVASRLHGFIDTHRALFATRVRERRIIEGHGDLRPEHIYLTVPPVIVDCLEFDRLLRLHDPVDELAFLAMECDRLDHPEIDAWLFAAYQAHRGDDPPRPLIDFHKAFNAFVRTKTAVWHLDDPQTGPRQHWIARANDYLTCATHYM